jgi:phytol kinase
MLNYSWLALAITLLTALIWLRLNDLIAHKGWISSLISRKIIHIGTGPIYVICWLLFPDIPNARYLAALVPLLITLQFALIGAGIIVDQPAVDAMSRTGNRREILRGPLFYGIVFVVLTIIYWKNNPIGIIALMLLCGGDGFADIIGNRWGKTKLPFSKNKSWLGSFGMLIGGWTLSIMVISIFIFFGYFNQPFEYFVFRISILAFIGMIIESLSPMDFDNLFVPAVTIIIGTLLFL